MNTIRFSTLIKKICNSTLRIIVPFFVILFFARLGYAQPNGFNDSFGVEEALQSISKYTNTGYDRITPALEQTGYQVPEQLKKDWQKMPVARRVGLAYKSAMNVSPQNGEKFLAMLSQSIAQQYGAINDEPSLQKHLNTPISGEKITFKHMGGESIKVTPEIKKSIMTIGKYTEAGALGGMQNIMKNYFDLPDDVAYDILEKSNSHNDALQRASKAASIPPPPNERFGKIANDIHHNYGSAQDDPKIQKLREKGGFAKPENSLNSVSEKHMKKLQTPDGRTPFKPSTTGKPAQLSNSIKNNSNNQYQKFVKTNYKGNVPKFGKAVLIRGGFGGVIFGNSFSVAPDLLKPAVIRWIAYDTGDAVPTGHIEFMLKDGTEKTYGPIPTEDFIAAVEIVNNVEFPFKEGDAIGLVGIENRFIYPDSSVRWEVVLHPAVNNLRLGWAFPVVDAIPIATNEVTDRFSKSNCCKDQASNFLIWKWFDMPETWKITESEMLIRLNKNKIEVVNPKRLESPNTVLSMIGFKDDQDPQTEKNFEEIAPSLIQVIPEYYRANEFAKTLALLRWAKKSGAKIPKVSNIKFDDYVDRPHNIIVTNKSTISFWSFEDDKNSIQRAINESCRLANDSALIAYSPVINLHKSLENDIRLIQNNRTKAWEMVAVKGFDTLQLNSYLQKEKSYDYYLLHSKNNGYFTKQNKFIDEKIIKCDKILAEQDSLLTELIILTAEVSEMRINADSLIKIHSPDSLRKYQSYMLKIENLNSSGGEKEDIKSAQDNLTRLLRNTIPSYKEKYSDLLFGILMYRLTESSLVKFNGDCPGYMAWKNEIKRTWRYLKKEEELLKYYSYYYSLFNQ